VKALALLLLLPSLASAQFTQNQRNGLIKSLTDSVASVQAGEVPVIIGGTRVTFGGTVPATTPCIRCSIYLDDQNVTFLGLNPNAPLLTGPWNRYAILQVCGAPNAIDRDVPVWFRDLAETCSKTPILAAAVWPRVTVAHRTDATAQAVATGFSCACRQATGTCNWTPPLIGGGVGAAVAAPFGMTIPAGLWTGAGCRLKSCVELYGFESYPPECPLN